MIRKKLCSFNLTCGGETSTPFCTHFAGTFEPSKSQLSLLDHVLERVLAGEGEKDLPNQQNRHQATLFHIVGQRWVCSAQKLSSDCCARHNVHGFFSLLCVCSRGPTMRCAQCRRLIVDCARALATLPAQAVSGVDALPSAPA